VVVDGDWVVAHDEFDVGVLRRHDFSYTFRPDRAVHHANALHLQHEVVLPQARVLCFQPVEPFGCADFLDVEILEERRKVTMPFAGILARKGADGVSSARVDVAEKLALNLVIHSRAEEGRIQVPLAERPRRRRNEFCFLGDHATI
jgi:hypothetical protein